MSALDLSPAGPLPEEVESSARAAGVVLFGAGGFARAVARALAELGIPVAAFAVSKAGGDAVDGIPVVELAQLSAALRRLPLWLAVFNRAAASDLGRIAAACRSATGVEPVWPQHYYGMLTAQLDWRYWLAAPQDYAVHADAIERTLSILDDAESRAAFQATLVFRLGRTQQDAPQPSIEPQYFPAFMRTGMAEHGLSFVDGGAYDGDTVVEAMRYINPGRVMAFEPEPGNFARLIECCRSLQLAVECRPCGLSNVAAELACLLDQGEASSVHLVGEGRMQVVPLDACLDGTPVDYLKLDVEGHELQALAGARETIRRWRPRLAVAAYHLYDDLWRIPAAMRELQPDYRIGYRLHAHNTFDAVFYAY